MQATGLNFSHKAIYFPKSTGSGCFGCAHHRDGELRLSKGAGARWELGPKIHGSISSVPWGLFISCMVRWRKYQPGYSSIGLKENLLILFCTEPLHSQGQ